MPQATNVTVHTKLTSGSPLKREVKSENNGESFLGELTKSLSETKVVSPLDELMQGALMKRGDVKVPIKTNCKEKVAAKEQEPIPTSARSSVSEVAQTRKSPAKVSTRDSEPSASNKSLYEPVDSAEGGESQGNEENVDNLTISLVERISQRNEQGVAKAIVPVPSIDITSAAMPISSLKNLGMEDMSAAAGQKVSEVETARDFALLKDAKASSFQGGGAHDQANINSTNAEKVQIELLKAPISFEKPVISDNENFALLNAKTATEVNESDIPEAWSHAASEPAKAGNGMTSTSSSNQGAMILPQQGQNQQQFGNQSGQQSDGEDPLIHGISGPANGVKDAGKPQSFGAVTVSQGEKIRAIQELSKQLKSALHKGETHMIVRMNPDELGAVDIKLNISKDGNVAVFFKTEQRETMELLAKYAEAFQQVFQDAGLKSDMAGMNFSSSQHQHDKSDAHAPKMTAGIEGRIEEIAMDIQPLNGLQSTAINIQV